jgi:hypothetical protein
MRISADRTFADSELIMADNNETQSRKTRRPRQERRFQPSSNNAAILSLAGTVVGALLLGGGIYSQWMSASPLEQAPWIVGAGAVVLAAVILWGDFGGHAIRVGDAGVAMERPGQPIVRVNWSVVRSITTSGGEMKVTGESSDISFAISRYPSAAAWIMKEGARRVPKKIDVPKAARTGLPEAKDSDGEVLALEKLQVTGTKCKASGKVITFEKDARTCPKCGDVYHRDSVPETCMTCEADLQSLQGKPTQ